MPNFEHTIDVAAPIEQVYAFGLDPENWRRSTPSITDVEVIEETGDGLRLNLTYQMLGRSIVSEMTFRIVDPGEHTVTTFDSPSMRGEMHYHYAETPDGAGTTVTQRCEYEFGDSLVERMLEPVAARYNKRQFRNALETSKELVEAEVGVTA